MDIVPTQLRHFSAQTQSENHVEFGAGDFGPPVRQAPFEHV